MQRVLSFLASTSRPPRPGRHGMERVLVHAGRPDLVGIDPDRGRVMLCYTHAVWGLALNDFFGPDAWISRELVDSVLTGRATYSGHVAYSLWWLVPQRWIWPAYAVMMLPLALFTVGLWTRIRRSCRWWS